MFGDIRDDAADRIDFPFRVPQRELVHNAGMGPVFLKSGFFKRLRLARPKNFQIVFPESRRLFLRENIEVRFAGHLLRGQIAEFLKFGIYVHVASFSVLNKYDVRTAVQDRSKDAGLGAGGIRGPGILNSSPGLACAIKLAHFTPTVACRGTVAILGSSNSAHITQLLATWRANGPS